MVRIKCVNPGCTGPEKRFEWDESRHVQPGGGIAAPHAEGAVRLAVVCPHCGTENGVWATGVKKNNKVTRKIR